MTNRIISGFLRGACLSALTVISLVTLPSCEKIYEDLDPCPQGLRIRFVYDYNMEFANAFPSQVDCLTVFFYDEEGKWVATRKDATHSQLSDENWRMTIDLAPGKYTVLAYGGINCENASFSFTGDPETVGLYNVGVHLNPGCLTSPVGTELHPLFYGLIDTEVVENALDYCDVTVDMMKDTNNLRVLLQQATGAPIDNKEFDFQVIDNNTLFNWDNDLRPAPTVSYYPWARGNAIPGELPDDTPASVAWAEMSFPRLVTGSSPRLVITHLETGRKTIDIPLNNYLLLLKSQRYENMRAQEFLDRESRWSMVFFLDSNLRWISTTIVINDWVVRINDTEL